MYNMCLRIYEWNCSRTEKNYAEYSLELFMDRFSHQIVWLVRDNGCLLEKQETLKYLENRVLLSRTLATSKMELLVTLVSYYKSGQIYYKPGQLLLLQIVTTVITNRGSSFYYKSGQIITNWGRYYKPGQIYYKSGQVLQIGAIITNRCRTPWWMFLITYYKLMWNEVTKNI